MSQLQTKFIKDSAVTNPKIANNAVDQNKISSSALGSGLTGGSGSTIAVDTTVVRTNGANAFTADQSLGGHKLTNVADPTSAQDAATKHYVDNLSQGLSWKNVVRSATTGALPSYTSTGGVITASANGALPAQDGVTLVANDRLLVKDESGANQPHNGIYVVTQVGDASHPFILTRATDSNTAALLQWATLEIGADATTQAGYIFREGNDITTLDTDNVAFIILSHGLDWTFGNGLQTAGNNVTVKPADASIAVSGSGVAVAEDPAGAISTGVSGIKVNVDGTSIDIATNAIEVKNAGVTLAKLASNSVDENKIVSTALSSTGGLTGGSGTKLAANVDSSTIKVNGSNQLETLKSTEQQITLSGTDITNQYVDLAHAVYGSSASVNSIMLNVIGGLLQQKTVDYTVSLTGGSGGVTRVTFAGDLATGGNAALVAGDILTITYEYLT